MRLGIPFLQGGEDVNTLVVTGSVVVGMIVFVGVFMLVAARR